MASPVPFDYSDRVLKPGYTSCLGCGEALVMRIVAQAAGKNSIFTSATGCSEIFTSRGVPASRSVSIVIVVALGFAFSRAISIAGTSFG